MCIIISGADIQNSSLYPLPPPHPPSPPPPCATQQPLPVSPPLHVVERRGQSTPTPSLERKEAWILITIFIHKLQSGNSVGLRIIPAFSMTGLALGQNSTDRDFRIISFFINLLIPVMLLRMKLIKAILIL